MYPYDFPTDLHRLSTQQHVSLDKYQQMIDNVLRWQQDAHRTGVEQKPTAIAKRRSIFATILNIFVR